MLAPVRSSAPRLARGFATSAPARALPIPPKVATPDSVRGPAGSSAKLDEFVDLYSKLPKGAGPAPSGPFAGKNVSGKPILFYGIFLSLFGYTLGYKFHFGASGPCSPRFPPPPPTHCPHTDCVLSLSFSLAPTAQAPTSALSTTKLAPVPCHNRGHRRRY